MPEDHVHRAPLIDRQAPPRPRAVRPRHAASLVVYRGEGDEVSMLMGMRGAKHRFMPNRLVFPGGAVDRADLGAPCAAPLTAQTEHLLRKNANERLAHGLGIAAARELHEETGLSLGSPPRLDVLHLLARAVTPPPSPIRFNARFFVVDARHVSGTLGGDGELEGLRFYGMAEALSLDLAMPTRRVLERLRLWLAMSATQRAGQTHTPVMHRDRGWRME
ncbi:MAG TPA: NUDIX hydrolase [Acetobacteraceae bacterium]|nr:NUDIX hydrolase [Acetobacteraceae bacterium]